MRFLSPQRHRLSKALAQPIGRQAGEETDANDRDPTAAHHSPAPRRPDGKRVAPGPPGSRSTAPCRTAEAAINCQGAKGERRTVIYLSPAARRRHQAPVPSAPKPAHPAGPASGRSRARPGRNRTIHLSPSNVLISLPFCFAVLRRFAIAAFPSLRLSVLSAA